MERLKVVSLFCGCGGMDLGLLGGFKYQAKNYNKHPFEIIYAVDNDKYCASIYNDNFKHKCVIDDVKNLNPDTLPEFDILIGGFPCQSFSISAQNPPRLGYKDERGLLFFEMVKILKAKKPRIFIAENVKGLLSANNKKAFPMIIQEFKSAGYNIVHKLVNASDYGIPQKRERVIIIGFRDMRDYIKYKYPQPTTAETKIPLRTVLDNKADNDEKWYFSNRAVTGLLNAKETMNKGRVQNPEEPCNTISSHVAKVSLNSTDPVLMINGRHRRLTPIECARIQSFPDSFRLESVSDCRKYKAIGNAVPPVLMWHIAKSLQDVIFSSHD